jgi:long-chain acyl-CoA synthetase
MVPTMLSRIEKMPLSERNAFDVSSMRALGVGAAPITPELKLATMDYFGDCLYENYGSSETGMAALLRPDEQRERLMSCGRPYDGVSLRVTGDDGRALGFGEVGDIWIDTPIGIDRYFNHPALPPDKYSDGFFRTGDIGRMDAEGYLYLTDRTHDLIIAGGVNIYPAEIERVLKKHPAVLDVAVFGVPNDDFGEAVHAICEVGDAGQSISIDELTNGVLTELAAYKRPRTIEFTQALPRNAMGKILKRVLREPYWTNHERNR